MTGKITVPETEASSKRVITVEPWLSAVGPSIWRAAMENGGRDISSKPPSRVRMPSRKAMVEMWPSPTQRSDITTRTEPSINPLWSGWGTIDGFISAAEV